MGQGSPSDLKSGSAPTPSLLHVALSCEEARSPGSRH